jgi:hypothetical protein
MLHATVHWKATVFFHNRQKFHKSQRKLQSQQPAQTPKSHFALQRSLGVNDQKNMFPYIT